MATQRWRGCRGRSAGQLRPRRVAADATGIPAVPAASVGIRDAVRARGPSAVRPPGPPALDSAAWAQDYNEVKELGAATGSTRTPEQSLIAQFWADGAGTETPPGHWNSIARDVSERLETPLIEKARLFALLNVALADAAICAWDAKYTYAFWRPVTAIRNGDIDGNDDTVADPTWSSFIVTPPFPDYVSGHSTFSGAAATVLALFYRTDDVAFTATSDFLRESLATSTASQPPPAKRHSAGSTAAFTTDPRTRTGCVPASRSGRGRSGT